MGVHSLSIQRIEDKEIHHAPQAKHAPAASPIMGDVRASHVAGDQYGVGIMGADGGIKHSAATSRPNNAKTSRPLGKSAAQAHEYENCAKEMVFHRLMGHRTGN
jgi:hypothetical protein